MTMAQCPVRGVRSVELVATNFEEAGKFYEEPNPPSDEALLSGLQSASRTAHVFTYPEYYRRQPPVARGPHPWIYLCLPSSQFIDYAAKVYATPADFAYSLPRFSPWLRSRIRRPLACLPEQDIVVRFQCSRMPPVTADTRGLVATNRSLFERARALGGKRLITSAIPMTRADWIGNFGAVWSDFASAKDKFDPRRILTPGPGIFS